MKFLAELWVDIHLLISTRLFSLKKSYNGGRRGSGENCVDFSPL